jgi:hypothetical protein
MDNKELGVSVSQLYLVAYFKDKDAIERAKCLMNSLQHEEHELHGLGGYLREYLTKHNYTPFQIELVDYVLTIGLERTLEMIEKGRLMPIPYGDIGYGLGGNLSETYKEQSPSIDNAFKLFEDQRFS